jgi:hypothetical protein
MKTPRFLAALVVLVLVTALPALAQTDTTNVALTRYQDATLCSVKASISHASVANDATYTTQAFSVADWNGGSLYVYLKPSADTTSATIDFSVDGSTWKTVTPASLDTVTTATLVALTDNEFKWARLARFNVGWIGSSGNTATSTLMASMQARNEKSGKCLVYNSN